MVELGLLLEHVLDQSSASISHLAESVPQSLLHHVALVSVLFGQVGHVPDVVGRELVHTIHLHRLDEILLQTAQGLAETRDVLDQDVVASNHDFGSRLSRSRPILWLSRSRASLLGQLLRSVSELHLLVAEGAAVCVGRAVRELARV